MLYLLSLLAQANTVKQATTVNCASKYTPKADSDNRDFTLCDCKFADWTNIKAYLDSVEFYQLFHRDQPASVIIDQFYHIINSCKERFFL
jgi:hypothetical protein